MSELIKYQEILVNNAEQQHIRAGAVWTIATRSEVGMNVGQEKREFEDPALDTVISTTLYLMFNHQLSSQTSLSIDLSNGIEDTTEANTNYRLEQTFSVEISQIFSSHIASVADLVYAKNQFIGEVSEERADEVYAIVLSTEYIFKESLIGIINLSHEKAISTESSLDRTRSFILFGVAASF